MKIVNINKLKLGWYRVKYDGIWQSAELVKPKHMKEPYFRTGNDSVVPHELLESKTVIPIEKR